VDVLRADAKAVAASGVSPRPMIPRIPDTLTISPLSDVIRAAPLA
jgi:hypothetical protein